MGPLLGLSHGRGCTHGCQEWDEHHELSPSHGRVHPWVPRAEHGLEHPWLHAGVHPMDRCTHGCLPRSKMGCREQWVPLLGPSHGRGCTHGCQELNIGWSTNGSIVGYVPWIGAPMGASQDEKWGVEINGSIVGSVPWKREHPWVPKAEHWLEHQWWLHDGVHPMEEGAPMSAKGQSWAGAPMAPC